MHKNYYTYDGKTKLGSSTHTYNSAKALATMATLKGTAPNKNVLTMTFNLSILVNKVVRAEIKIA